MIRRLWLKQKDTKAGIGMPPVTPNSLATVKEMRFAMPVVFEISALLPRIRLTNSISYGWYLSEWQRLMGGAAV